MQREVYIRNLEGFAAMLDEYIEKTIKMGMAVMMQIRFYNTKMKNKGGYWFWWKHEGTRFKFFKNKNEQRLFSRNLESIDRIDKTIQVDIESELMKAEYRLKKTQN